MEGQQKEERKQEHRQGKRKKGFGDSTRSAYASITFSTPLESTGHPMSPHRFFKESYEVSFQDDDKAIFPKPVSSPNKISQVVHHHVNGLCIVTAGSNLPEKADVAGLEIVAKEAPSCSAAEKRKRQSKMLKGGKVPDTVSPTSVLAYIALKTGKKIPLYACVWGSIIEINQALNSSIMLDDPLLDGYLAIILPSGKFPPESRPLVGLDDQHKVKMAKVAEETTCEDSCNP